MDFEEKEMSRIGQQADAMMSAKMPPPPTKIRLLGRFYAVRFESPGLWAEHGLGRSSTTQGAILISTEAIPDEQRETVLHEIVHMTADMLALKVDEAIVAGISAAVFAVLRDNPEWTHWMMGA